jgi:tetratricopeptide (TPR) repeat protein/transcriptional regulator with XRE-family HTH domain
MPPKKINQLLRSAREQHNWSQKEVAEAIGTTVGNVSRWERGLTSPAPYYRRKLCDLFGKEASALGLQGEEMGESLADSTQEMASTPDDESLYDPAIPVLDDWELIGRDAFLEQLKQQLCAGNTLALHGLPGIGKTALAQALVHDPQIQAHFADGVLWAALGPQPNSASILSRWGTLLEVPLEERESIRESEAWARSLRTAIGSKRLLIVIDDAWKPEEAVALKVGGPHCTYLLTTRFPGVAATFTLKGAIVVPELSEEDGLALLARLCPEVMRSHHNDARSLVRSVGALPLGLVLMGKYLHVRAYGSEQQRRIRVALEHLHSADGRLRLSEPIAPTDRHPGLEPGVPFSLLSMIAVSERQLDRQDRAALCALSVFPAKPHSFSESAALFVSGCTASILDRLLDAGLLESAGPDRYCLHQTIADYARMQLRDDHPWQQLIAYCTHELVESYQTDETVLEQQCATLLAALEAVPRVGSGERLLPGVCHFALFLLTSGLSALAEPLLVQVCSIATSRGSIPDVMKSLLLLGRIAEKRGQYLQARSYLEQALKLARHRGSRQDLCRFLTMLGVVEVRQGNYAQAERYFQEGLLLARRLRDDLRISLLLINLGWLAQSREAYAQAERYYQEALPLARHLGQREELCVLLVYLGEVTAQRGNTAQAAAYYEEGLYLARQLATQEKKWNLFLNRQESLSSTRDNLAAAEAAERRIYGMGSAEEEACYQEGLTLAYRAGYRELLCRLLEGLAATAKGKGEYQQAGEYYREELPLVCKLKDRARISLVLLNIGEMAFSQGKLRQAAHFYEEGLQLARSMQHPEYLCLFLLHLAELKLAKGEYAEVEACLQEGFPLARQQGDQRALGLALALQGDLHLKQHHQASAEKAFREILNTVAPASRELVACAWYGLARVLAVRGEQSEAVRLAQASLTVFATIGHHKASQVRRFLERLSANNALPSGKSQEA